MEHDIIGKKYGKLTVVRNMGLISKNGKNRTFYECVCDCGTTIEVRKDRFVSGHTKSCGCLKHEKPFKDRDLTGRRFGKLVVVSESGCKTVGSSKKRKRLWNCACDCGNNIDVGEHSLLTNNTRSCGCLLQDTMQKLRFNDLTGNNFGRLLVLRFVKRVNKNILWECKCDCGKVLEVRGSNLITGGTKSCGCLNLERLTKHGLCKRNASLGLYMKHRRKDPSFRLATVVSNAVRKSVKNKKGRTFDYLPYTSQQLKEHLESLWEPWMNWENYGDNLKNKRRTWWIDHVIPQSDFKYTSLTDAQFVKCWELSNLRPLEKFANLKKSNKHNVL